MSDNIIERVRKDLDYAPLHKIDPNIQEVKNFAALSSEEKLAQAAITAVLAGFFKFTRTDTGCNYILTGGSSKDWLDNIFVERRNQAVEKVAQYAGISADEAAVRMEDVAKAAVIIIHEAPGEKPTAEKLRFYMSNQRHNILVYLPPVLQLGYLLNDNAIDDRTNKMEGPVSNFMHRIEDMLSEGDESKYP
jgi:hypothetical protein